MTEKLIVSAHCQTGGLAAALRAIFPELVIVPIPTPAVGDQEKTAILVDELRGSAIWLTNARFDLAAGMPIKIIKVPDIIFRAFHPDLCYARKRSTRELTKFHYNSRIAIWAFNKGMTCVEAELFFRHSVYEALGYFFSWFSDIEEQKKRFITSDLTAREFDEFLWSVKKQGVFMHTMNHPRIEIIVELAKILARKLGGAKEMIDRQIIVPDALTDTIWPVYPEIGQQLGVEGNYVWRFDNNELKDLRTYLDFAFGEYAAQDIQPNDLEMHISQQQLDALELEMNK